MSPPVKARETLAEKRDRLLQVALGYTRPFDITDVGVGPDYATASRLLRDLHTTGDLEIVSYNDLRKHGNTKYAWRND